MPGRQRWEAPVLVGRPRLAGLLTAVLGKSPGVTGVRASAVTGSVLVHHDPALGAADIGGQLRAVLDDLLRQAGTPSQAPPPPTEPARTREQAGEPAGARKATRSAVRPRMLVAGGAAASLALGGSGLLLGPWVALGAVGAATTLLIRRAWHETSGPRKTPTPRLEPAEAARPVGTPDAPPLLRLARRHRRRIGRAAGLSAAAELAELGVFTSLGALPLLLARGSSPALTALGVTGALPQLGALTAVAALAKLVQAALSYRADLTWRTLGQDVEHELRSEVYPHVERLPLRDLEGERTTRIAGVLSADIPHVGAFLAHGPGELVQLATCFLVMAPAFLLLAPRLAWAAFLPVPVITWLSLRHHSRSGRAHAAVGDRRVRLNSQVINTLEGSATVKSYCTEAEEAARVERLSDACRNATRLTDRETARHIQTVGTCASLSLLATGLLAARDVFRGTLSLSSFNTLLALPSPVLYRLTRIGTTLEQYQHTLAALDRVEHLRNLRAEPDEGGCPLDLGQVEGELVLDGVTFAYPGRPPVLQDTRLRFMSGRTTAIVGATGAGKTTIAKLLMRFQDPVAGRILLDGRDIRELRLQELRRCIGFVAQDAFLFDGTIAENIAYGTPHADHAAIVRAAGTAQASGFIEALPQGYDTVVGERGAALSGGQRQRIALARTILKDPPVVILDEATSAVDNDTEAAIQHALRDFTAGRTTVVIAHRLSTIRHADWIHVMNENGTLAEEGSHQDLLAGDGQYASLWRLQTGTPERDPRDAGRVLVTAPQ
ncbi:ATP-binding cassette domain-containing protein [Streptomyces sp. NPDC007205]|uniref:ABC transporter ATP-binding protein/permease n=1 Tax=Streptomyces sp. NPDC007205 TaxID=3154316 RepID=UPI0033F8A8C8